MDQIGLFRLLTEQINPAVRMRALTAIAVPGEKIAHGTYYGYDEQGRPIACLLLTAAAGALGKSVGQTYSAIPNYRTDSDEDIFIAETLGIDVVDVIEAVALWDGSSDAEREMLLHRIREFVAEPLIESAHSVTHNTTDPAAMF